MKGGRVAYADDDTNEQANRPRRKVPPIKVWVTDAEKVEIADRAAQVGLSLSAYMLAAGLNHPIRSVYDLKAVADLGRINGDLGRVAGLLKLWLAEKRGQGARPIDVDEDDDRVSGLAGRVIGHHAAGSEKIVKHVRAYGDWRLHRYGVMWCSLKQTTGSAPWQSPLNSAPRRRKVRVRP